MYIDKLASVVNKYNNTYHSTSKIKSVDVNSSPYIELVKKIMKKILSLKLTILPEYQNLKIFLQKATLQIGLKKFL